MISEAPRAATHSIISDQIDESASTRSFWNKIGFQTQGQTQFNWWFTSDDDDDEEYTGHAIDYDVEGLQTWSASGAITWNSMPLFGGSMERPFRDTPRQREILKKTTEIQFSIERYLLFLQLTFLRDFTDSGLIAFLSGLRLDYYRHLFFGRGEAVETALFVPRSGEELLLSRYDEFRFKALFQDWNFSFLSYGTHPRGVFRFGLYRSQINKPHETTMMVFLDEGDAALVMETELTAYGIFVDIESRILHSIIKIGTADFKSMAQTETYDPFKSKGGFDFQFYLKMQAPFALFRGPSLPYNGFYITPQAGIQFRADYLNTPDQPGIQDVGELSMDIILMAGITIEWLFH